MISSFSQFFTDTSETKIEIKVALLNCLTVPLDYTFAVNKHFERAKSKFYENILGALSF